MPITRVNFNVYEAGEDFLNRLEREATQNLQTFFGLLSSYWRSTIQGPSYSLALKAMSLELARTRLMLEDSRTDTYYNQTRTEFLYQVLTSIMFPSESQTPNPELPDIEFRDFLNSLLGSYYRGSTPKSLQDAVNLFVDGRAKITENFLQSRKSQSGFDISDQFTFDVDIFLDNPGDVDVFLADKNIRLILNILRPAHTLFKIRFILQNEWFGQKDPDANVAAKIIDDFSMNLSQYSYEDFRRFCDGISGVDYLGVKQPIQIINEDHSFSF